MHFGVPFYCGFKGTLLVSGCLTLLVACSCLASALEADAQTDPAFQNPQKMELAEKLQRQAEALSLFAKGIFEEESDGPETAVTTYRQVLELDPAYTELAIKVAYDYLRRGDSAEALSLLKDVKSANPKDPAPRLALASVYLRQLQKPELAAKYAALAMEAAPDQIEAYQLLNEIYLFQGQVQRARQILQRAASRKSTDPLFWFALAESLANQALREGNSSAEGFAAIAQTLNKAIELAEEKPLLLNRAGDFYIKLGRVEEAVPLYERALERQPDFPKLREKLAECYLQLNQSEKAIAAMEAVLADNPLYLRAYEVLGDIYTRQGELDKAVSALQQALIINPHVVERQIQVAGLLLDLRKFNQAAEHLAQAQSIFPQLGVITYYRAIALNEAKRSHEALQMFEQALREAGGVPADYVDGNFYFQYGAAAEQAGQIERAVELFRKSIAMDPNNAAPAYNYLGYMWVDRNENLEEAEQLIRRALEIDQTNGAYIDSLGWLFYRQGRYEEALRELKRAVEYLPAPDAVVFDHIGDTYAKLGKMSEAVLYWNKALQLDPENKNILAKIDAQTERMAQKPKKEAGSR